MISLKDIKKRKLGRWTLTYLAAAWFTLQFAGLLASQYEWPNPWFSIIVVVLCVGFFLTLTLAWYHGERGTQKMTVAESAIITLLLVIGGATVALLDVDGETSATAMTQPGADNEPAENSADTTKPAKKTVAVLPFADMSSAGDQEYFADGLTEELLNALAQLAELRVAARTSSYAFKGEGADIRTIGNALGVAHVVEGSVRKAGDRVRITAQLIEVESGFHLWSDTYERKLDDIFAIQGEISRAIARELRIQVGGEPLVTRKTNNPEAHMLYLRGLQKRQQSASREKLAEVESLYRQALAEDPGYALALASLAEIHAFQAYHQYVDDGYARAREEAKRALALDPNEAVAHWVLGFIADFHFREPEAAEKHYRRALELNPSDARAHSMYALQLLRQGQPEASLRLGERAVELDPLSPAAVNNLGVLYYYTGQYARAERQQRAALLLAPQDPYFFSNLATTLSLAGKHAEASSAAKRAVSIAPGNQSLKAILAFVYARGGQRAEAEQIVQALTDSADVNVHNLAMAHLALGETDRTFELLERAIAEGGNFVADIGIDPALDPLRDDPRMDALLEKIKRPLTAP